MISEVANALLLTFFATEYLIFDNTSNISFSGSNDAWKRLLRSRRNQILILAGAFINVLDRVSGLSGTAHDVFQGVLHVPKILFAAIAYIIALYADCRRNVPSMLLGRDFLPQVLRAFCYVLPVYPFIAVLISFGFLFVINLFEFLRIPLEYLNMPIYYGTLYGPFSLVYWRVKEKFDQRKNCLPG